MLISSEGLSLTLTTSLGLDTFILDRVQVIEQASAPYVMTLEMHSPESDIDLEGLVGAEVFVEFTFPGGTRHFNGIIGEIEQGHTDFRGGMGMGGQDVTTYTAKVYPHFWLLKFSQDHQIFQNMSALEIIKKVLNSEGVTDVDDKTSVSYLPREYCVQYRESYFNYVSRLMEEEGMCYTFDHQGGKTSMVLGDQGSVVASAYEDLEIMEAHNSRFFLDQIQVLNYAHQVVSQKYAGADYNFKTASTKLYDTLAGEGAGLSVYRYPGGFKTLGEGSGVSKLRIQELEWYKKTIKGQSTAPLLTPLSSFGVSGHARSDLNRKFLVYKVIHDIRMHPTTAEVIYRNDFVAFPDDVPFHAPIVSPKPIIPSTQTAVVTGKPGEEIWCDEYGRIKVQFHWDQKGKKDDKSSCWIRVAQLWAGSAWGGLWTPRVGMEVVVTFLEGDPDKPLITGCVYNSDNMPMYAAAEPTKSTIKSNSTKGGGGFNEFRFEDKKKAEEIYIHAEKDMNTVVEESRTLKINEIDDTSDIYCGNRLVTLHGGVGKYRSNEGHDTLVLKKGDRKVRLLGAGPSTGNHTLEIIKGDNTIHITKGDMKVKVDLGNFEVTIIGNISLQSTGNMSMQASGNISVNTIGQVSVQSSSNIAFKAAGTLTLEAGKGLSLKGPMVKLN